MLQTTASMGTAKGLARDQASAPEAAGTCGFVGKKCLSVRAALMTEVHEIAASKVPVLLLAQGKVEGTAIAAGPSEDPDHAGRNRAAAPAACNPLVPAVHTMASAQTRRMALNIITLKAFPLLIYLMQVNRQQQSSSH